ncbi:MAG: glycosyltransferase family 9 protein [Candidatus Velthaea sp.]
MNVLAVRQDNNGDVLLAGPALRALAAKAARVALVCGPSGAAAANALPGIDETIVFEAPWIEANPRPLDARATDAFVRRIAAAAYDAAVIFTSFHQSALPAALLLRLAGVPRIGAISVDYPGALLDVRHRVDEGLHEVERALSLAEAAGFPLPPDDDGRLAMRIAERNPVDGIGPYVVVHPGATVPARAWNPERNRALVARLARDSAIVVTGSPAERALCAYVAGADAVNLCGETDFATLAAVIAGARAVVVGNTGAAHVAAAAGTPVVSLFAPTIPNARFHPWRVPHVTLGDQSISCAGCRARECPFARQPCLDTVTVGDVVQALAALRGLPELVS